tara:strand:- start:661 stop:1134 length:474 start_codon:yes stop_codon:yes gene_type:complete
MLLLQILSGIKLISSGKRHQCKTARSRMGSATVLLSLPGGLVQAPHCDVTSSVFFPLEASSHLIIFLVSRFVKIELEYGQYIVFNRKLVHCGGSYEKHNRRIHVYLMGPSDGGDHLTDGSETSEIPLFLPLKKMTTFRIGDAAMEKYTHKGTTVWKA